MSGSGSGFDVQPPTIDAAAAEILNLAFRWKAALEDVQQSLEITESHSGDSLWGFDEFDTNVKTAYTKGKAEVFRTMTSRHGQILGGGEGLEVVANSYVRLDADGQAALQALRTSVRW